MARARLPVMMQAEPVPTRDPVDQPTLVDLDLADEEHQSSPPDDGGCGMS